MSVIIILAPDNPFKPLGGCGTVIKNILEYSNKFYYILGQGYKNESGKNFEFIEVENNPFILQSFNPTLAIYDGLFHRLITNTTYMKYIYDIKLKHEKVIIHCFDWFQIYSAMEAKRLLGIPYIFFLALPQIQQIQMLNHEPDPITFFTMKLELEGMEKANRIHFASQYCKKISIHNHKNVVITHGISNWEKKSDYLFPGNANKLKLVYIGRVTKQKGIQYLLDIELPDNVELFFFTSDRGSNNETGGSLLSSINNNNRFLMGPIYDQEKIDMMCSADAIIMPSTYEPYGLVALEALRSKTLLLTSLVHGIQEITNENISLRFDLNKSSIEKTIQKFSVMSEEEYNSRVDNGYQLSLSKTVEKEVEYLELLYNTL